MGRDLRGPDHQATLVSVCLAVLFSQAKAERIFAQHAVDDEVDESVEC